MNCQQICKNHAKWFNKHENIPKSFRGLLNFNGTTCSHVFVWKCRLLGLGFCLTTVWGSTTYKSAMTASLSVAWKTRLGHKKPKHALLSYVSRDLFSICNVFYVFDNNNKCMGVDTISPPPQLAVRRCHVANDFTDFTGDRRTDKQKDIISVEISEGLEGWGSTPT